MAVSRLSNCLSLNRWAEIMGVDPVIFNGGYVGSCSESFPLEDCDKIWPQFRWQDGYIASRDDLARAIKSAENDIEEFLCHSLCDKWVAGEEHMLSNEQSMSLRCGNPARMIVKCPRIKSPGTRNDVMLYSSVSVTYTDDDLDGLAETGTVIFAVSPEFDESELCTLFFYTVDYGNQDGFRIKPYEITYDSVGNTVTAKFFSWDLIRYNLLVRPPRDVYLKGQSSIAVDICDEDNLYDELQVWQTTNNICEPYARVYYKEHECKCNMCSLCREQYYDACIRIIDADAGLIEIRLVEWRDTPENCIEIDGTDCAQIPLELHLCEIGIPYRVELSYLSGCPMNCSFGNPLDECDTLCYEEEIAILAAARLPASVCGCGCDPDWIHSFRTDWAVNTGRGSKRRMMTMDDMNNPFGTREGELEIWNRLRVNAPKIKFGVLL